MYALKLLHHFHFTVFVCLLVIIFHLFSVTRMYTKPVALPTEIISFLSICLSTYLLYLPTYLVMSSLASDGRVHVTQTDRQTDRHCPQLFQWHKLFESNASFINCDNTSQASTLLPPECTSHTHCLPSLVNTATSFEVSASERGCVIHHSDDSFL